MTVRISKTNENMDFFNTRLDEVRMSGHERLKAKAHLARAEAFADAVFAIGRAIRGLFVSSPAHPAPAVRTARTVRRVRRMTPSAG